MKSELTSSNGVRLIRVAAGSFIMGSPPDEAGRAYWEVEREVTLPYEFYLGATPVTQRQYERIITCPPYAVASWAGARSTGETKVEKQT
jgi:formylglycine-generating enzyme required for sulfatase activity